MRKAIGPFLFSVLILIGLVGAFFIAGCSNTSPTDSPAGDVGRTTGYVVVTDWSRIPSNNDQATDIWVRVVKIEGICYLNTNSVHDWEYSLVPTGSTC